MRKRVIKIFRDICVEHSEFEKVPEMCVKMIRRVNDEEGIKVRRISLIRRPRNSCYYYCTFYPQQKLVNETFETMWFTPLADNAESRLLKLRTRVMNITDVVNACKDTGYEWFEHLLQNVSRQQPQQQQNQQHHVILTSVVSV